MHDFDRLCVCACEVIRVNSPLNAAVGGDGGTKALGRKYLRGVKAKPKGDAEKSAKTEAKKERAVALLSKSALSGSRLEVPVVADAAMLAAAELMCARAGRFRNKVGLLSEP